MNTQFKPQIIGQPDAGRINQVTNIYDLLCVEATALKSHLQMLFAEDEETISHEFLTDLLNHSDPENFIRTKWVEHKKISIPGINMQKLIASDLLEIPAYEQLIESIGSFKQYLADAKALKFSYDLSKLVNEDGYYSLNKEFHDQLNESGTVYTENEQQNQVLEAVTELKNARIPIVKLFISLV